MKKQRAYCNILVREKQELFCEKYDEISPLYLRVSQAEREYQEKEKGEIK